MKVYEFGDKNKPVILLLPGTCCYWKGNFGHVIQGLQEKFYVACVSYSGFDDTERSEFVSMIDETEKIENFVKEHFDGRIHAAYGCSLGGSFVGLLIARQKIHMDHGIIGSSDFDQSGKLPAKIMCKLFLPMIYHYMQTGNFKNRFLNKRMKRKMCEMGEYGEAFMRMMGIGEYDLGFISMKSAENQFYSDMITELPEQIDVPGTKVHIFYALKMGEKYRARYHKYFKAPDIIEMDLLHEELLAVKPAEWKGLVEKVCEV